MKYSTNSKKMIKKVGHKLQASSIAAVCILEGFGNNIFENIDRVFASEKAYF